MPMTEESNISNMDEDSNDSIVMEAEDEQQSSGDSNSDLENEKLGNSAWADAMCKVLNTNVNKKKIILSKAKKDTDVKANEKKEIELVDESGNVINIKPDNEQKVKSYKEKRREMIEKHKQKAAWESMCRVKPDVINKDKERELVRIATRGVVHLFNTVEKHQKSIKNPKEKNTKRKESLGVVKGTFMDILKGHSKNQLLSEEDPVMKKVKHEETWNILKDDFMMGAEMKDWDKDSDND